MIGIIDYNMGNVGSVESMINFLGYSDTKIISTPQELSEVDKIILPGVGSFDNGISSLKATGMLKELNKQVITNSKYILGICLGMQLFMEKSEEGKLKGLGWIEGECKKFLFNDKKLKIPHMGWNIANPTKKSLCVSSRFYFVHSYYVKCSPKYTMLETTYGITFPSGISKNNIFGVQFHPEKSHKYGMELIQNFINL